MTRATISLVDLQALTPDQAAARWLVCGALDASPDREAFEAWLALSPAHPPAWRKAQAMWTAFDDGEANDLIAAMARAARQAGPERKHPPAWLRLIAASLIVSVASAALVAAVLRADLDGAGGKHRPAIAVAALDRAGPADYVTGPAQRSIVDLPDGTRLTLDADTAIDVVFKDARRDVNLMRGRAFFDVAHDRARPFSVRARGRVVTALGTQFAVGLTSSAIHVVLAEGRVSVAGEAGDVAYLAPGQAYVAVNGAKGAVAQADLAADLSWKQNVLEFNDAPLSEIVAKLNRYTRAQIVIRDPKIAGLRATGVFRTGDIGRFGRSISQVLPVRLVNRNADTFELVSARR